LRGVGGGNSSPPQLKRGEKMDKIKKIEILKNRIRKGLAWCKQAFKDPALTPPCNNLYATMKDCEQCTYTNKTKFCEGIQRLILLYNEYKKLLKTIQQQDYSDDAQQKQMQELFNKTCNCQKCHLSQTRLNFVFGAGNPAAKLVFVGEAPGFEEDHKGIPFIGKAGQLLDKALQRYGISRKEVYITNVVKCHPMKDPSNPELRGNDRQPTPDEIKACLPILKKQIEIIKPRVICTLGKTATAALIGNGIFINRIHGEIFTYKDNILLIPTFHPAYLLRSPERIKEFYKDIEKVHKALYTI